MSEHWSKVVRPERLKAGLCRECGKHRDGKSKIHCEKCRKHNNALNQKRLDVNRKKGCACGRPSMPGQKICAGCSQNYRSRARRWKQRVIDGYGGKCFCCGETQFEFLGIDHVNKNGHRLRKELGWREKAVELCRKIVKLGFPPDYRVACHNCNQATGAYGYCPHQKG